MVQVFKTRYPEIPVLQFKFSESRPDLTKLDSVFGLLSIESDTFIKEINEVLETINRNDVNKMIELLNVSN